MAIQMKKKKKQPPGATEQYKNIPPDAPRPKAKGRGEMLKRNLAPQTAPLQQQDPLASLPSHHEKNQQRMIPPSPAQTHPEPTKPAAPAGIVQPSAATAAAPIARGRGRGR